MAQSITLEELVRGVASPLTGADADLDPVIELIGDAHFVLIGEASHGTHEFYDTRARLTKRLIEEKGFGAVAAEADWPDAYQINGYVQGESDAANADDALGGFGRFPTWMWRNTVVRDFVEWLKEHNQSLPKGSRPAGFYGLDLYSMYTSIQEVVRYLDRVDPDAAMRARARYECFEHFGRDAEAYGYAATSSLAEPCEQDVVDQLLELRQHAAGVTRQDGRVAEDEAFYAEQNARLVVDAEEYYRTMFYGSASSWNLRDKHMAETLEALVRHLDSQGGEAKVVLWAHNSHLGDARATEMSASGELNVGQLVREVHGDDSRLIGFTTYDGTVTAASNWDRPAERKRVRRGLTGSYEALFHDSGAGDFLLPLRGNDAIDPLREHRLERAIGVIYRPETERISHYFLASLPRQFDAVFHMDHTSALEPLERTAGWEAGEPPETYPFAQ